MSKQWIAVLVVVVGLAAGAYALTKFSDESGPVDIGRAAPEFRAIDLASGDTVSLRTAYKGQVTLVNIWATWCVPCKTEMPAMQEAFARFKDQGFKVVAVSIDEGSEAPVKEFTQVMGLTFDVWHDRLSGQGGDIQLLYQTTGVPESFLLDKDGLIVKRVIGAYDWSSPASTRLIARTLGVPEPVEQVEPVASVGPAPATE